MSIDNYVLIRKESVSGWGTNALTGGVTICYVGYEESASAKKPTYSRILFTVYTLEDAIVHAEHFEAEYGYRIDWQKTGSGENAS